jgi:hypothetical protein
MMSVRWVKADIAVASVDLILIRPLKQRVGVVKSLEVIGSGPVALFHPQKSQFFKTKNPLLGLCSGGSHSAACAS